MNKRTLHRPLALLLALAMTLTLFTVPALATDGSGVASTGGVSDLPKSTVTSVKVGGETLTNGHSNKAGTAKFEDKILTLENYSGGGINVSSGSLTILVKGENHINEPNTWGIQCWRTDLTIYGESKTDSILTIHSQNSPLNMYEGTLTVSNLKEFNCSSTTTSNPIIGGRGRSMTFSDIGTMLVRGNTSYVAVYINVTGKNDNPQNMTFKNIDTLEVLNDNAGALRAEGGLTITDCGTALFFSKNKEALYFYGKGAKIEADRLIAVGSYGVYGYLNGSNPVDLTGAKSMLLVGRNEAYYGGNSTAFNLPKNYQKKDETSGSMTFKTGTVGTWKQAKLNVPTEIKQEYSGDPVTVTVSAVDKDTNQTIPASENMTYLYAWYDEKGTTPLMEAPTDVGIYTVKVYGVGNGYYSDFSVSNQVKVEIEAADAPSSYLKTVEGKIANGYNIYDLPAIPEGMSYGTPEVDKDKKILTSPEKMTANIAGGKLSVTASELKTKDKEYVNVVTVPVTGGTDCNYNDYTISYTLTAEVEYPLFNLCDGTDQKPVAFNDIGNINTNLYTDGTDGTDGNPNGAWKSDFETAAEFGYTFEGWYTAPNGWGTKVANNFYGGTTYFAHWVATRAVAGYATVEKNGKTDSQLAYVQFGENDCRTVYTTGLDFRQASALGDRVKGDGYDWNATEKKLTLDGVLINSGTSSQALILPHDATIYLADDTRLTGATEYYTENGGSLKVVSMNDNAKAKAYNNVCGGGGDIPSMEVGSWDTKGGGLTIRAQDDGCAFSVRGGAASVIGGLTLEKNALLSTQGIDVAGSVILDENSMLATVDPNQVQTRELDLFVGGDLKGSGMLIVDGDITAESNIDLYDGATLMTWGALQANNITLSQLAPLSACDSLYSLGTITLNNAALELDGEADVFAVNTKDLTIENGSNLTIKDYVACGIIADGNVTVNDSTVTIKNASGKGLSALSLVAYEGEAEPMLYLQRARMADPNGAYMKALDDGTKFSAVGEDATPTLTIQPYHSSSSGSSNYTVKVNETKNGTVTPSATRVGSGSTVTLTVDPDGAYVLDTIKATNASGKEVTLTKGTDGKYTFKMPSSAVTVNASFRLRFTDVDPNAWYFDGVQDSVKKGLMEGMSETIFAPNGTLTRAQLVTILWRMEQQPSVNYALPFTDVAEGQWYTEAVRWAASTNVVNGTSATTFTPDAPVTREQLVAMLWRYAKQKGYDVSIGEETNILSYPDATSVSEYAIPAMQWACGSGIIQGADGKLLPKDSTTRAQIATIFQRFGALKA